ncbi:MAG: NAD-dependent epimerase/dehydratase family protein, partial [Zoogloeaceae bacterium]|nr:NAD-dependent epimerase/dehydratase family protein [Zoogloeaceae bacterium]
MNVLICGADGFLGRAIVRALATAGHHVIRAVHHPRLPGDLAVDYRRDLTLNDWLPRLSGVNAVVNAVGILREPLPGD